MKEAYGEILSLTEWLKQSGESNNFGEASTFPNLIRWSNAITQANLGKNLNFDNQYDSSDINRIAVVNIKKSSGKKESNGKDLTKYVSSDWDLLEKQIVSLKPDFIVCCGTFDLIKSRIQFTKDEHGCRYNKIKWLAHHKPYIINFVHPASRGMRHSHMYYALAAISAP